MTAPRSRHNTSPGVEVTTALRPASVVLMLISIPLSGWIAIAIFAAADRAEGSLEQVAFAFAVTFGQLLVVAGFVHWRAGGASSVLGMIAKVALWSIGILASGYIVLILWKNYRDDDLLDFAGADLLIALGAWALLIFLFVAVLLSSVRAAAHRIRER